jgi:undecaprenyl-diphosphatase
MRIFVESLDTRVTKAIQRWPQWLRPVMRTATFIGLPVFTIFIGVLIAVFGMLRESGYLIFVGAVIIETILISSILKRFFKRARPLTDYVLHMRFSSFSLPSGHAVGGVVAYGTLGYLIAASLTFPWSVMAFCGGIIIAFIIGVSRVYLGAHYPSDVIAGWILGAVGLLTIIFNVRLT